MTTEPLDAEKLLQVWEEGRKRHPVDRALLLHSCANPESDPGMLANQPLGWRNRALLALREACFGPWALIPLDCPCCGASQELEINLADLRERLPSQPDPIEVEGLRFRLPSGRDLIRVASEQDEAEATRQLLKACLILAPGEALPASLPPPEIIGEAFAHADPLAAPSLDCQCPACEHRWGADYDILSAFWQELDEEANRLIDQVHRLASAYGWHETDILRMSESRRLSYLSRLQP